MTEPTGRTTLRRLPERGSHDDDLVAAIVDEAPICHLGVVDPEGRPFVVPTIHTRIGDRLYLHGSPASRALRGAVRPVDVCVTVTLLDGLVLARSAFHHSMNYRSVVVYGQATKVEDREEKLAALEALVDHVVAGRSADARPPNDHELRSTLVVRVPLDEASAKVRTGGPKDDDEDMALPIWAGVVPIAPTPGTPIPDPLLPDDIPWPAYELRRPPL